MSYEFDWERGEAARVAGVVRAIGVDVAAREHGATRDGTVWKCLTCSKAGAVALVSVATREDPAAPCAIGVSVSITRVPFFWRWCRDASLAREIARAIRAAGALDVTE